MRAIALLASLTVAAGTARADGYYFEQSMGVSSARGDAPALATQLHLRMGVGVRFGAFAVEPWLSSDVAFDRDGAYFKLFGGTPAMGQADLSTIGVDFKYTAPVGRGLVAYVRGGPRLGEGDGALEGYSGPGIGVGTGIQLSGKVSALGLLWAPLFFSKKGPKLRGSVFLDESVDAYRLYGARPHMTIDAPIVSTNLGFALGSDF